MQRIGRTLMPDSQPTEKKVRLPILYKLLALYYSWRIHLCNKQAEKFGKFSSDTYQYILWYGITSERAGYLYKRQALIRKAEYRNHVKEVMKNA